MILTCSNDFSSSLIEPSWNRKRRCFQLFHQKFVILLRRPTLFIFRFSDSQFSSGRRKNRSDRRSGKFYQCRWWRCSANGLKFYSKILTPMLAASDIAYAGGWSLREQFSFNLPYSEHFLNFLLRMTLIRIFCYTWGKISISFEILKANF